MEIMTSFQRSLILKARLQTCQPTSTVQLNGPHAQLLQPSTTKLAVDPAGLLDVWRQCLTDSASMLQLPLPLLSLSKTRHVADQMTDAKEEMQVMHGNTCKTLVSSVLHAVLTQFQPVQHHRNLAWTLSTLHHASNSALTLRAGPPPSTLTPTLMECLAIKQTS